MGLRGPGAARLARARQETEAKPRRLPWKKKGLSRVERVIAFLEFLPVTKGILAGQRMKLLAEQREFVSSIYGPVRQDGRRLVSLGIQSEPKGNGKTGECAGLALCHLLGPESEPRGEVYSAAIDRQQAGIMFAEMEAIIYAVPEFASRVNIQRFHKRIEVLSGDGEGSTYEALSADARRAHGLAPSLWIYDELAQSKERTLLDNLMEGMGKRREALGLVISTQAPTDDHPLSQLIDDALTGADPSTYLQLLCAPEDADPFDEETWRACNPAWGRFLDIDDFRKSAARAQRLPAFEPAFRNLRLNQRVDARADERVVTPQIWKLGAVPVDAEQLAGRRCYGGLDLSGKHDLCALELVFPDDDTEPTFDILSFFWTPSGQMENRTVAEQTRFRQWIREGHLIEVPGPTIRFGFVARFLADLAQKFDIRSIGYDRYRIDDFEADLEGIGLELPMEPWGQGYKDMTGAIEFFAECALTGRLRHGGHPVLTAAVSNAILMSDPADGKKFNKPRGNKAGPVRIDGAVALAVALGVAHRHGEDGEESIYESEEFFI